MGHWPVKGGIMNSRLLERIQDKYVISLFVYDLTCQAEDGEETLDSDIYPTQIYSAAPISNGDRVILGSKDEDRAKTLTFEVKFVEHDARHGDPTSSCLHLELIVPDDS